MIKYRERISLHFLILSPFSHSQAGRLAQLVQPRVKAKCCFGCIFGSIDMNCMGFYSIEIHSVFPPNLILPIVQKPNFFLLIESIDLADT